MSLMAWCRSLFDTKSLTPIEKPVKDLPHTIDYLIWMINDMLNPPDEEDFANAFEVMKLLEYVVKNVSNLPEPRSCAGEKQTIGVLWKRDNKEVYVEMHYHGGFYWTAKGTGLEIGKREFWNCHIPDEEFLSHLRQL